MKEFENLENRLRSWKPRQPSPAVKQKVFGATSGTTDAYAGLAEWFTLRCLAPAMACVVIGLLSITQLNEHYRGLTRVDNLVIGTLTPSNGSFAFKSPMRFDLEEAAIDGSKFQITNATIGPLGTFVSFAGRTLRN